MTTITLALDFGASSLRAIFTEQVFKTHLYIMQPEVCPVTPASIEYYTKSKIGTSDPTRSGWIETSGTCWAIGNLAQERFKASLQLEKRKFELALPKALALIGAISQLHQLPNGTHINLGAVLPYGEYHDRELFEQILREALTDFKFCGVEKYFTLETFLCLPEGGGVLAQGRQPGTSFQDLDLVVAMLGYRDVSLLFVSRGELSKGETQSLGFASLVKSVAQKTSLHNYQKLTLAICKAGSNVNPRSLTPLLNNVGEAYKDYELAKIQKAILDARAEYWLMLSEWLKGQIKSDVDEVIIAGGTAQYFKAELNTLLKFTKVIWCDQLEKRIRATFPDQIKPNSLEYRLADVYGLFFYLYARARNGVKSND